MRVSEVTTKHLAEYLRLDPEIAEAENDLLISLRESAIAFIRSYTGLSDERIEPHADIAFALRILVQDMYDNRTMYVDKNNLNKTVKTILDMHAINLL